MPRWPISAIRTLTALRLVTAIAWVVASLRLGLAGGHGGILFGELFIDPEVLLSPLVVLGLPILVTFAAVIVDAVAGLKGRVTAFSWVACALSGLLLVVVTWNLWRFGDVSRTVGLPATIWLAHVALTATLAAGSLSRNAPRGFPIEPKA